MSRQDSSRRRDSSGVCLDSMGAWVVFSIHATALHSVLERFVDERHDEIPNAYKVA